MKPLTERIVMGTTPAIRHNREYIEKFYDYLQHSDYGITEIRVINPNRDSSNSGLRHIGYFSNRDDFVQACMDVNYGNVYASLNPVPIEFLNRADNLLRPASEIRNTVRDEHIEYVTNIMLDIDPERPTGTASTQAEMEWAISKAHEVEQYLIEQGLCTSEQIQLTMSGNGCYVLLAIPRIEVTDDNRTTIKSKLRVFEQEIRGRFQDTQVKFDPVQTLSHLVKVIGTVNINGDNTHERPYRVSYPMTALVRDESNRLRKYILDDVPATPVVDARHNYST